MNSDLKQVLATGGKREISAIVAPIERLPERVGALVSSDDNYLSHGGGISLQLWNVGRIATVINENERRDLHLGDVYVSGAGYLNADHLLHAITIDFDTGQQIASGSPTSLVRSVLATAERLGCKSVALPMLGTGVAGLAPTEFLRSFVAAAITWAEGPSSLEKIYLVVLPSQASGVISSLAPQLRSVEWAETVASGVSLEFADLGAEWLLGAEFPIEDRNVLIIVFEELCRRVAILTGALSQREMKSTPGRDVIAALRDRVDDSTLSALDETWLIRNQVSHSNQVLAVTAIDTINHGISSLLLWTRHGLGKSSDDSHSHTALNQAALSSAFGVLAGGLTLGPLGAIANLASSVLRRQHVSDPGTTNGDAVVCAPSVAKPTSATIAFSGENDRTMWTGGEVSTTPLRELRLFVDRQLKNKAREAFLQKLANDGYDGEDQIKILEFLIREPELDKWVANEFPYYTLQTALAARGVKTSTNDRAILARQLLESFGFPCARNFKGIENVLRDLENISNELLLSQTDFDGCRSNRIVSARLSSR